MERVLVDILGLSTNPASGGAYALILREVEGNAPPADHHRPGRGTVHCAGDGRDQAAASADTRPDEEHHPAFGAELTDVMIDDLRDGTFYAKLNIDNQLIDSRPSDAIALAVRYGAQIFVSSNVMDEASFVPEEEEEEETGEEGRRDARSRRKPAAPPKETPPNKMTRLEQLHQQLKLAIEKEDYEKAAALRDEIRRLETRD